MSNLAISFKKLVDEAVYAQTGERRYQGSVTDPTAFFANLDKLTAVFNGMYAFLAFHPGVDKVIPEYVQAGSISSDAGPRILVLFLAAEAFSFPRRVSPQDLGLGVDLDMTSHPAYQFVGWLFPAESRPPLPGLVFFDDPCNIVEAVYVPLTGLADLAAVAQRCRRVFIAAEESHGESDKRPDLDRFAVALRREKIDYVRSGKRSFKEFMVMTGQWLNDHRAEIASLVSKATGSSHS